MPASQFGGENQRLAPTGLKRCGLCAEIKALDRFQVYRQAASGWQGRQSYCQDCQSEWRRRDAPGRLLRAARARARKQGLTFTLRREDIRIPSTCPVLGIPLENPDGAQRHGVARSLSIDRRDNTRGYTPDNIVVVSWRANRLKGDATPQELQALAAFYSESETHAG